MVDFFLQPPQTDQSLIQYSTIAYSIYSFAPAIAHLIFSSSIFNTSSILSCNRMTSDCAFRFTWYSISDLTRSCSARPLWLVRTNIVNKNEVIVKINSKKVKVGGLSAKI